MADDKEKKKSSDVKSDGRDKDSSVGTNENKDINGQKSDPQNGSGSSQNGKSDSQQGNSSGDDAGSQNEASGSSGLQPSDDGNGIVGAKKPDDDKSKGGAYTKAMELDKKKKASKGSPQNVMKKGIMGAIQSGLMAFKAFLMSQLMMMLHLMATAIAAVASAVAGAIASAVIGVVTMVATAIGVSVAAAGIVATLAIVAVIAVVVVVAVVVNSNTAVKDELPPCDEVNLEYMDIPDGITPQAWTNAKLIYTFFKSYGNAVVEATGNEDAAITDEMVAAILGNWMKESGLDTTAVETVLDEPFAIGPKKMFFWKGGVSVNWVEYLDEDDDPYYGYTRIDPFYDYATSVGFLEHENMSGVLVDYVDIDDENDNCGYGVSSSNSYVTHSPIMFEVQWFHDIYMSNYWANYHGDTSSVDYMGIGLGQWSNGRNTGLMEYGDNKGHEWYDLSLQLMYSLVEPSGAFFDRWVGDITSSGRTDSSLISAESVYKNNGKTAYTTHTGTTYVDGYMYNGTPIDNAAEIAIATESFLAGWEGILNDTVDERVQNAFLWYTIITEWQEGVDYTLSTGSSLWESLSAEGITVGDMSETARARSCNDLTFFGNSSLAEAMVSYAWGPNLDAHNDGTLCWKHIWSTIAPGDDYPRSCDRTVAIGVRWSGTDSNYPLGSTKEQLKYLMEKNDDYQAMMSAGVTAGMTDDTAWWQKIDIEWTGDPAEYIKQLRPGDVLIRNDLVTDIPVKPMTPQYSRNGVGHTLCYVGSDTIRRRWPDADPSLCIVSGSLNTLSPHVGTFTYGASYGGSAYETYYVFRCMKPYCSDDARKWVSLTCAGHSNDY